MTGLLEVEQVRVGRIQVEQALMHLRRLGRHGLEGFALWAGTQHGARFDVSHTVIPQQQPVRTTRGVCVSVEATELHRLNVWLFQHRLTLVAQIHSHPADAYHSDTDDQFPIATTVGSLSIVVPDFAVASFSLDTTAVYRLASSGLWRPLTAPQTKDLLTITG